MKKTLVSLGSMAGNIELHDLDDIQSLDLFVATSDACGFIDNSEMVQAINYGTLLDASNNSQCDIDPVRCVGPLARTLLSDEEIAAGISDVCYKNMLFYVNGDKIEKVALGIDVDKSANYSGVQKAIWLGSVVYYVLYGHGLYRASSDGLLSLHADGSTLLCRIICTYQGKAL